jgi:hypothetical protein
VQDKTLLIGVAAGRIVVVGIRDAEAPQIYSVHVVSKLARILQEPDPCCRDQRARTANTAAVSGGNCGDDIRAPKQ